MCALPLPSQAWDDVVRKEKPKEDAFEYKKRLTLDHEKSKLSLAEIYEQEYIKLSQVRRHRAQLLLEGETGRTSSLPAQIHHTDPELSVPRSQCEAPSKPEGGL